VFIVGVPRSGTTLLRQMLRGSPSLAIPRESHFIPKALGAPTPAGALDLILSSRQFATWEIDADLVRGATAGASTPAAVVRAAFEAYAREQGRPRWGDKTPHYVNHIDALARAFGDAVFVHIVRDGREVADSLREQRWGPPTLLLAASAWRKGVTRGREAGERLGPSRYLELRYEELVAAPAPALTRVCEFLGEETALDAMFDYASRAAGEHPVLPHLHRHLAKPPTPGLRDWRGNCSPAEQLEIEAVMGPTLVRFGYEPSPASQTWWRRTRAESKLYVRRARARLSHQPRRLS
jgi:LPS sulfotransferase NodH